MRDLYDWATIDLSVSLMKLFCVVVEREVVLARVRVDDCCRTVDEERNSRRQLLGGTVHCSLKKEGSLRQLLKEKHSTR